MSAIVNLAMSRSVPNLKEITLEAFKMLSSDFLCILASSLQKCTSMKLDAVSIKCGMIPIKF